MKRGSLPGKFPRQAAQSHFVLVRPRPSSVGKRARTGGGAGKGLVAFINRWDNLDAHPLTRIVTRPRSALTQVCGLWTGFVVVDPLKPNRYPHNKRGQFAYILPRQTRLVARATSYVHTDYMCIISAHVHSDLYSAATAERNFAQSKPNSERSTLFGTHTAEYQVSTDPVNAVSICGQPL